MSTLNPLGELNNSQLFVMQLMVRMACNRAHSPLKGKQREYFCAMGRILDLEANNRGTPIPVPPYHVPPKSGLPPI